MRKALTMLLVAAVPVAVLLALSPALVAQTTLAACTESITLFEDVSRFGRKNSAAKNMTETHQQMAAEGWSFVDQEVLYENADLEGFYLTYTRPAACPV
ncbi:hypothetical protein F3N42_14180 [Marinihelvus fidelis]|uniref:DUF4177 domain-containing protein n=1 Tax=Marinihelvus fidelis TaxID=2613842 RepID=A0A5N0T6N4_9GAMM|nr:hypothetical protein [Marinihelvus fidelis]KAA9129797.1 hypothetical protein F3N42_14180 [Marinihelvus fidelis]